MNYLSTFLPKFCSIFWSWPYTMPIASLSLYILLYAVIPFIPPSIDSVHQWTMSIFRILAKTHFMWPLDSPFHPSNLENGEEELIEAPHRRSRTIPFPDDEEVVDCAVCLCQIEEEEEIWELACDHVFHRGCLNRWLRYGRVSCPLCRGPLPRVMAGGLGNRNEDELGELPSVFLYSSFLGSNFYWSV